MCGEEDGGDLPAHRIDKETNAHTYTHSCTHRSSLSLAKYFWACVRICSLVRVVMISLSFFHAFPYCSQHLRKRSCSSSVQWPSLPSAMCVCMVYVCVFASTSPPRSLVRAGPGEATSERREATQAAVGCLVVWLDCVLCLLTGAAAARLARLALLGLVLPEEVLLRVDPHLCCIVYQNVGTP